MGALLAFWGALIVLAFAIGGFGEGAGFLWFMTKFVAGIIAVGYGLTLLGTAVDRVQEWREYRQMR